VAGRGRCTTDKVMQGTWLGLSVGAGVGLVVGAIVEIAD
jgi:ElaB/YqjD/DUF883 family membrane-anchored ribosome-binding protein